MVCDQFPACTPHFLAKSTFVRPRSSALARSTHLLLVGPVLSFYFHDLITQRDEPSVFPFGVRRVNRRSVRRETDSSESLGCLGVTGIFGRIPTLTFPCGVQVPRLPSPTMRQGYLLQRPSAVVPLTTDSRPRSLGRARDRRSNPAVPLVLRKITVAKALSLIGRVKLTCLTTV